VANKADKASEKDYHKFDAIKNRFHVIYLSAKKEEGISELKSDLSGFVKSDPASQQQIIVSNARHYEALKKAEESLRRVKEALETQIPGDLVAMDIRNAIYHLGEITGAISSDDLLGNIFSKFCIGK
jgi:tRNA modification GTPase